MSDATELRKLVKSLQGAASEQETISVLNVLKKEAKITEALLRVSTPFLSLIVAMAHRQLAVVKAGLAVGKLRSHARKEVADLAKEIVKKWKTEVEKEKQAAGVSSGGKAGAKSTGPSRKASTASATPTTPTTPLANNSGPLNSTRTAKSDGVKLDATGDKTRDKCMELIYDALAFDSGAPSELIFSRAKAIESAVLTDQRSTNAAYKNKIRQLIVNLKDKNNPGLRESVTSGDIPASKFAKMTSQEMASEERKAADNKIKQDNFFQSLGAEEQQAETDAFQCGRCKQRKCRYRQAQTRSADEPMTTFVTVSPSAHILYSSLFAQPPVFRKLALYLFLFLIGQGFYLHFCCIMLAWPSIRLLASLVLSVSERVPMYTGPFHILVPRLRVHKKALQVSTACPHFTRCTSAFRHRWRLQAMSQEPDDVKPKLNLVINYEGHQITIKVRANTEFKKIFEAAEKRFGKDPGHLCTFKFVYEGERVNAQDTPAQREMEDGDIIDAHLEQLGGGRS
ncbi:hypothetical protein EVG20_g7814 [Dentipellis fragilis]|uniref:TFIIS N-terminal domain-containing protein n=1 Tax=Dentipellis fragilis TaxID=205917 RepID=A0A4Y9YD39_9AGAM|nr:hypothetical protein EVG20_g7814 [Dentipellis fragilis]